MPFCFGFDVGDRIAPVPANVVAANTTWDGRPDDRPSGAAAATTTTTTFPAQQLQWYRGADLATRLRSQAKREMVYNSMTVLHDEIAGHHDQIHWFCKDSTRRLEQDADGRHAEALVQTGVYEGGSHLWEGSVDLAHFLASSSNNAAFIMNRLSNDVDDTTDSRLQICELGCGHALPAIYLIRRIMLQQNEDTKPWHVTLTDFNDDCVHDVLLPNLVLNTADQATADVDNDSNEPDFWSKLAQHVTCVAGDWHYLSRTLCDTGHDATTAQQFDCILAAETLYTPQAAADTAAFIARHLRHHGMAYVATKRYYFGAGGGTDVFVQALTSTNVPLKVGAVKWNVQVVHEIDNGNGNIREILRVQAVT